MKKLLWTVLIAASVVGMSMSMSATEAEASHFCYLLPLYGW